MGGQGAWMGGVAIRRASAGRRWWAQTCGGRMAIAAGALLLYLSVAFFSSSVAKLRPFKSGQRKKLRKW
uniref:Uncharacterized protein n=1 Tax=Oryza glaberrima TaxID=4538 RepID=I1PSV0_ORYGL